jgi:hypothetical protein
MASSARRSLDLAPARALPRVATSPLERAREGDRLHDYVLGEYAPLAPPAGKLRSVALLVEALAVAGVEREGLAVVERLRDRYGPFRIVFGVKWDARTGALAFELYFYDFGRAHADCSLAGLSAILDPLVVVDAEEPFPLPWHMLSIELDAAALRERAPVPAHVYLDMRSYELRGTRLTLENVYTFHDPRREIDDVLARLRASVHLAPDDGVASVLPPALLRCGKLCVANKRTADAVYASRVPASALAWLLDRHGWPAPLRAFVRAATPDLDHLLFCLGADFRREGGRVVTTKSGFYGSF